MEATTYPLPKGAGRTVLTCWTRRALEGERRHQAHPKQTPLGGEDKGLEWGPRSVRGAETIRMTYDKEEEEEEGVPGVLVKETQEEVWPRTPKAK